MTSRSAPVNIIVPVYRNLQVTRRCIHSVLASTPAARYRLLVIDDASPEPELSAWCDSLAADSGLEVLRNPENLGFVATVNRAIEHCGSGDILLLNSDTEVANDWLDRLQHCAYSGERTGTVTPLSNNASVCSYPIPLHDNSLPEGWTTASLDRLAATCNVDCSTELPTAVGFCMYIRRDCLEEVGPFDVQNFGLGYGEECDFSMRARARGWQNLLCPSVFVYHEGGQSFSGLTEERILAAEATLHRLHPQYHVLATRFIDEDPVRPFRDALDLARIQESPGDAGAVLADLRSHRDRLLDGSSNREMALEHALGELRASNQALEQRDAERERELCSARDKLREMDTLQHELTRLQRRDWRWKYPLYLINRLDAWFFNSGADER